jgi:hypothetical protein
LGSVITSSRDQGWTAFFFDDGFDRGGGEALDAFEAAAKGRVGDDVRDAGTITHPGSAMRCANAARDDDPVPAVEARRR